MMTMNFKVSGDCAFTWSTPTPRKGKEKQEEKKKEEFLREEEFKV